MIKADVALCCHNDANSLSKAIQSVLHQNLLGTPFIVDDGSVDRICNSPKFGENPK